MAIATANAILANLQGPTNPSDTTDPMECLLGGRDSILSLAADLQNILGVAMHLDTTMFQLKACTPHKGQTLPHHLWPKAVLHEVHTIRKRTKALRRLATLAAATPLLTL